MFYCPIKSKIGATAISPMGADGEAGYVVNSGNAVYIYNHKNGWITLPAPASGASFYWIGNEILAQGPSTSGSSYTSIWCGNAGWREYTTPITGKVGNQPFTVKSLYDDSIACFRATTPTGGGGSIVGVQRLTTSDWVNDTDLIAYPSYIMIDANEHGEVFFIGTTTAYPYPLATYRMDIGGASLVSSAGLSERVKKTMNCGTDLYGVRNYSGSWLVKWNGTAWTGGWTRTGPFNSLNGNIYSGSTQLISEPGIGSDTTTYPTFTGAGMFNGILNVGVFNDWDGRLTCFGRFGTGTDVSIPRFAKWNGTTWDYYGAGLAVPNYGINDARPYARNVRQNRTPFI